MGLGAITLRLGAAQSSLSICSNSLAIVDSITLSAAAGPGANQEIFTATCPSDGFGNVYTIYYGTTATGTLPSSLYASVASVAIPCNGTTVTTYTYPTSGTYTVRLHSCAIGISLHAEGAIAVPCWASCQLLSCDAMEPGVTQSCMHAGDSPGVLGERSGTASARHCDCPSDHHPGNHQASAYYAAPYDIPQGYH